MNLKTTKALIVIFSLLLIGGCYQLTKVVVAWNNNKRDLTENTVIVHLSSEPDGLHPTNDNAATRTFIFKYTQLTGIMVDLVKLEYIPNAVEELPTSEDGLKWTYNIKDNITWDDGTPFTGEDVVFTLKMWLCPLTNNAGLRTIYDGVIDRVEADPDDPRRFYVYCEDLHVENKSILSEVYFQQKDWWDPEGITDMYSFADFEDPNFTKKVDPAFEQFMNKFNHADNSYKPERLRGLGPYQVTKWEQGDYIELTKKENWWGDDLDEVNRYRANYPNKMIFKVITDDASAYLAVKNQQIDVSTGLGTTKLLKLQKLDYFNKAYHSDFVDQYSYSYIGMNTKPDGIQHKPFFTDVRVRRAIAHLVDVDEIIQVMVYGKAIRQVAEISPLSPYYNHDLKPIPFDVERAKQLLDEAGWVDTDGDNIRDKVVNGEKLKFSFRLSYITGSETTKEIVQMIKETLYLAGVELQGNPMDFAVFYKNAQEHKFDAMMGGWSGSAIPSDPTQLWHTSNWANKGYNFCGFGDAESDSLIETSNRQLVDSVRKKTIYALQKKIYDEQPYVFMYSVKRKILIHRRFDNAFMYTERPGVTVNYLKLNPNFLKTPSVPPS